MIRVYFFCFYRDLFPMHQFFITAAQGLAPYVIQELESLGIEARQQGSGVAFSGTLKEAYQVNLWSRCASRVLMSLKTGVIEDLDDLYQQLVRFPWSSYMRDDQTFAVQVTTQKAPQLHTHYASLRVKDAIVDYFQDFMGVRPNVELKNPDIRFFVHIRAKNYTLYWDMSGEPLHKRGIRLEQGEAPLRENLAAALLYCSHWPKKAQQNFDFLDPMCGAGTLLIEAALMAYQIAPGLYRSEFAFMQGRNYDVKLWQTLKATAKEQAKIGRSSYSGCFYGIEKDNRMIGVAKANAKRAEVFDGMQFHRQTFVRMAKPEALTKALIVTNPPYGKRLQGRRQSLVGSTRQPIVSAKPALSPELKALYHDLGDWLRQFVGSEAGVITSEIELGKVMGLKAHKRNKFFNGALETTYLQFIIDEPYFVNRAKADAHQERQKEEELFREGGEDFYNRLRKNIRQLERWAERNHINCYRVYDADLPEFNVAIDRYIAQSSSSAPFNDYLVVSEYRAPKTISKELAQNRFEKILGVLPFVFEGITPNHIYTKERKKQTGGTQYEKQASENEFFEVKEGKATFFVNLTDYLDTGLFLDHRSVRELVYQKSQNKRFLNLFCYTGSATVQAALGGVKSTRSVDLSNTYLEWAKKNMRHNGFKEGEHHFEQGDVLSWLGKTIEAMRKKPLLEQREDKYDLIFLDPPSFSNSKSMDNIFDIQKDHLQLISEVMRLVDRGGELIFSTNLRSFKMDESLNERYTIKDISLKTLPEDFKRNPRIRQCFIVTHKRL